MSENKKFVLPVWGQVILAIIAAGGIADFIGVIELSLNREDDYITRYIQCKDEKLDIVSDFAIKENQYQLSIQKLTIQLTTLHLLTDNIPFVLWVKNLDSEIIYVSDEFDNQILKPLKLNKADVLRTKGEKMFSNSSQLQTILENDSIVIQKNLPNNQSIKFKECVNSSNGISYKYIIRDKRNVPILLGGLFIEDINQ